MKLAEKLQELESLAKKKGIRVAYETLAGEIGSGGLCRVRGEYRVIVDRRATPADRALLLAEALAAFSFDDEYVAPEIRELIEKAGARRQRRST